MRVEDKVLSRDVRTGKVAAKRVLRTFLNQAPATVALNVGGERIISTPGHRFYVEGKGFIPAGQLALGTSIITRAGPALKLAGMEPVKAATATLVYNFEVEEFHTYFVGRSGLWVHNECSAPSIADDAALNWDADLGGLKEVKIKKANGELITDFDKVVTDEFGAIWAIEKKDIGRKNNPTEWVQLEILPKLRKYKDALADGANLPGYIGDPNQVRIGIELTTPYDPAMEKAVREEIREWEIKNGIAVGVIFIWL